MRDIKLYFKHFFILLLMVCFFSVRGFSQDQKSYFIDNGGNLYWNRNQPFYLMIGANPNDTASVLLKSKTTPLYSNPSYFDSEGVHYLRHQYAVDTISKEMVYPKQEVVWEVYADGQAPKSKSVLTGAINYGNFWGKGLKLDFKAEDNLSGLKNIYFTLRDSIFIVFDKPIDYSIEGEYEVFYYSVDNVNNKEAIRQISFCVDLSHPLTSVIKSNVYEDFVLNEKSEIQLISEDFLSGVDKTFYRVNRGKWQIYEEPLSFNNYEDGDVQFEFYSIDYVGNEEEWMSLDFYLDKTPPILVADILGDRYVANNKTYFSGRTKMKLTAVDNKAGVKGVYYSINDTSFIEYTEPFYLPARSGEHIIRYYSEDNVGNRSTSYKSADIQSYNYNVEKVILDLVGPEIKLNIIGPNYHKKDKLFVCSQTLFEIQGFDKESGLKKLTYKLSLNGIENDYSVPFSVDEKDSLKLFYFGYDNVNNRNVAEQLLLFDNNPPKIYHHFSVLPFVDSDNAFLSDVKLYVGATDDETGIEIIEYSINKAEFKEYKQALKGFVKGHNTVVVRATDYLGNTSKKEINFCIR